MLNIQEIAKIVNARHCQIGNGNSEISELLFDSRRLLMPERTLFFAISTERHDGHDYIAELVRKGVRNFVITKDLHDFKEYSQCNFLQVSNSVNAMQKVAAAHRQKFDIPVVGITGSNGKTIVKEWLTEMLADDYRIIASPNSYNSQIGVPVSVWRMQPQHELAIFEAGISQPGEMAQIAEVIQPTIGIFTNIGAAHAQFFTNEQEKLREKVLLFRHAQTIIYCADQKSVAETFAGSGFNNVQQLSWGENPKSAYHIDKKEIVDFQTIVIINGEEFRIPFIDDANVENAMHSIILLLHLKYSAEDINAKLAKLAPVFMRMEVKEAENQSIVINDTYSLDFTSLRVALDFLKKQIRYDRKTVILSDFAQAGKLTAGDYAELNNLLIESGITRLIGIGNDLRAHADIFQTPEKDFFSTTEDLLKSLRTMNFQQEAILVKGARSFQFERVVDSLKLRTHRTTLNISLPALINNLDYYRSKLSHTTKMMAMVKAQCYGLGDVELINELQYHRIDYLAVAYTDEGVNLRKKNIKLPIIVLGAEGESFGQMIDYNLEPEIFNFYSLREFEKALACHPEVEKVKIHLKVDTGMHRLGFRKEEIPQLVEAIKANPKLQVASMFSHLAAAEDESEDTFTLSQISYFEEFTTKIQSYFPYHILRHIDNSAGICRFPQAHYDMVRLGIGLYGFSSVTADRPFLQHVATLRTVITHVREIGAGETVGYNRTFKAERAMKIGIIPIGYADGFPPELGRGVGSVVVHGKHVPIVGKICMDMAMIDVTGMDVCEGDEVVVYGDENRMDDIAACIGKIPYHLLTSISKRVPRVYVSE